MCFHSHLHIGAIQQRRHILSDFWIISIHFIQKMTFSIQYLKYDAYLDRHTYIDRIAMKEKEKTDSL